MSFALLALGAIGLVAAQASETPKLTAECVDTIIFFARGNDAHYHDGRTTPFLDATCAKIVAEGNTCDYIDIQFDVTLGGPWCAQVSEGSTNGISQITAYQAQCPCTHIVIGGYSEGANVVGDTLAGGGCSDFTTGIDPTSAAGQAIAAAVVWGDPRHAADQSYNVLDGSSLQAAGRDAESLARLQAYASVLRNYCAAGDPICAGGDNVTQHLNYFDLYTDDAATWVVGKVDAAAALCDATSSSVASAGATTASSAAGPVAANSTSNAVSIATSIGATQSAIATPSGANASSIATVYL
ncbi:alpha/beta-hydrolase [Paraphaeosphaeria sporulosa]|uniref:Alpha/beta-hydrolase n=1 Tax=Paraphaeosphaeria sporulosa TaxID=1460663 RepID=A0A177CF42_9PLEO|nr:alpha/beta-hydrolase [Paraphaeosphaeria sporulosa]OAG06224.1 alpha/beta-hydrolase [Paraphaeosphaeria sporulosa]